MSLPPLCHELPYLSDSAPYFEAIRHYPWPAYLDSKQDSFQDNRFDIIVARPFCRISTTAETTSISDDTGTHLSDENPFLILQQQLAQFPKQAISDLPFCGGALGYFAYDLGRRIEEMPSNAANLENIPDMLIGIYDWALVNDHHHKRCWLASYGLNGNTKILWPELVQKLSNPPNPTAPSFSVTPPLESNLDKNEYSKAFDKIQRYIREGDCYQVNLAKRFEIKAEGCAWTPYQRLREQNPAPFSAFFDTEHVSILSSSPERLLRVNRGHIETKPIKGTRSRDTTNPEQDLALAQELQNSVKDRAENLMIVDLLRNDLGKVCKPGSINVPKPFALESFATVHHLVSTVTGELAEQYDSVSLLEACFPGGSITGAPKLRAMEIIEELEPSRRGAYCGSLAYIGFDGNMDSNILIRTLVYSDKRLRFWAGGGIVADSEMASEYQEVHDKAAALLKLIDLLDQS
jgi:para-aminobenzoate synthetase component 1